MSTHSAVTQSSVTGFTYWQGYEVSYAVIVSDQRQVRGKILGSRKCEIFIYTLDKMG